MENNKVNISQEYGQAALSKTFLSSVFTYMGLALGITGLVSYIFGTDPSYSSLLVNTLGAKTTLGFIVMFSPLLFVLALGMGFQKFSSSTLLALFLVFSLLMGMSISVIFLKYTAVSIYKTFFITGGTFGIMAILGFTTKTDLTKFGSILMMALIGIIIASIANWFLKSSAMNFIISCLGVLIFTGLTAYDVQKLKRIGEGVEYGTEDARKLSIIGALTLYLDFINLFLFFLNFTGNRKD
jgi:FtsH-binding integral membrane protein